MRTPASRWHARHRLAPGRGAPSSSRCANPACRAFFYDTSKNHNGRWCSRRCGKSRTGRRTLSAKPLGGLGAVAINVFFDSSQKTTLATVFSFNFSFC
ncbi:MAG: CGNR zinc finger domain-containing protein [Candidatus Binataceae bacterium]